MAIYRVQAPDGGIVRIEGPDNATQEQLAEAVRAYAKAAAVPSPEAKAQPGFIDRVRESITGSNRRTTETEAAPDWADMPELNSFSMSSLKTGMGTMLTDPQETVQVIQSNFPGVQTRQDDQGNFFLKSSIDGKEYAIKPGFRPSDIPRAAGAVAAFTPAGRATTVLGAGAAAAGTQAAIEASQAATGGNFDAANVAVMGATGAALPAIVNAARAAGGQVKQLLGRARGEPAPTTQGAASAAEVAPEAAAAAQTTVAAAPEVGQMSAAQLAQTARKAADGGMGSGRASRILAEQVVPDAKVMEAAKRLGIDEYLQPDHVTTNQAYRELAQAVKSVPGSEARAAELTGLEQVAKRADDLIEEIGGTQDVSMLDATVKSRLMSTQRELEAQADELYGALRKGVPARAEAQASNVLGFIKQRSKDLGGEQNLSPMERAILAKLEPKAKVPHQHGAPKAQQQGLLDQFGNPLAQPVTRAKKQPTYALLDDVRRDLTAARVKREGVFKDADTGLIKKLEQELMKDQRAAIEPYGMLPTFDAARTAVAVRKGLEDDLAALFGKNLDQSLVGDLSGAVKSLPAGDASKLVRLLKTIPEEMRRDVVASGLNTAFGKTARNGQLNFATYSNWYEGLLRNKQAYTALMANLSPQARKQLSDLYRVSKGISSATRERITTGRIQAVTEEIKGADTLMANIYGVAKRAAVGIAAEAVTTPLGAPGAGIASGLTSAFMKGKPNTMKAADALIASPEFAELTKQAGKPGAKVATLRLAYSKPFTQFIRATGQPRELSNREQWILQAMQAQNQQQR